MSKKYALMGEDNVYDEDGYAYLTEVALTVNENAEAEIYIYNKASEHEFKVHADLKDVLAKIPTDLLIDNLPEEAVEKLTGERVKDSDRELE